jgi:hypothetical protein
LQDTKGITILAFTAQKSLALSSGIKKGDSGEF